MNNHYEINEYFFKKIMDIFFETKFIDRFDDENCIKETLVSETFSYKNIKYVYKINFTMYRKKIILNSIETTVTDVIIRKIFPFDILNVKVNFRDDLEVYGLKYDKFLFLVEERNIKEIINSCIDKMIEYDNNEEERKELIKAKIKECHDIF